MAQSDKKSDMTPDGDFPLHEGVFKNDIQRVSQLIRVHDVSQKDVHGLFVLPFNGTNIYFNIIKDVPYPVANLGSLHTWIFFIQLSTVHSGNWRQFWRAVDYCCTDPFPPPPPPFQLFFFCAFIPVMECLAGHKHI